MSLCVLVCVCVCVCVYVCVCEGFTQASFFKDKDLIAQVVNSCPPKKKTQKKSQKEADLHY